MPLKLSALELARKSTAIVVASLGWLVLVGCRIDPGVKRTPFMAGIVVDRESGAPIAGVEVFATYKYRHLIEGSTPRTTVWATTDEDGHFLMPERRLSRGHSLLRTDGPFLLFFHPWYGFRTSYRGDGDEQVRDGGLQVFPISPRRAAELPDRWWSALCKQCERYDSLAPVGCDRFRRVACRDGEPLMASEPRPMFGRELEAMRELGAFLAATSESLVDEAVARGDLRFLAVPGSFVLNAPGVPGPEIGDLNRDIRWIPGYAGDDFSPKYVDMKRRALDHAKQFNLGLLVRRRAATR